MESRQYRAAGSGGNAQLRADRALQLGGHGEVSPKRILVPLDGSLRTESVLPIAVRIAKSYGAELLLALVVREPVPTVVLHTQEDLEVARELATRIEAGGKRYLEGLRDQLVREGASVRTLVLRSPDEKQSLLHLSQKERSDSHRPFRARRYLQFGVDLRKRHGAPSHALGRSPAGSPRPPRLRAPGTGRSGVLRRSAPRILRQAAFERPWRRGPRRAGIPRRAPCLEAEAREFAEGQRHLRRAEPGIARFLDLSPSPMARALERARKFLFFEPVRGRQAAEGGRMVLDNYYLIRRVARQVTQDLPLGFLRRLPELASGPAKGVPRIDALARALVARSSIEIDGTALQGFIHAYQEVSPLTIAELWALPTMLRVSVLHGLLHFLEELAVPVHGRLERAPPRALPDVEPFGLGPGAGVERSIRALRLLAELDWKTFFEKTNRVEAVLRGDPARIYGRMDFETCDAYRTRQEAEHYRVEPYVLAGDVYGAARWVGRGGWTWYTGAAAWAWRLGVEGILGLRMEDGELRIDPCIPPAWKRVRSVGSNGDPTASRRRRGSGRRRQGHRRRHLEWRAERFEPDPSRSERA